MADMSPAYLRPAAAAKMIGLSRSTLYRKVSAGEVTMIKVGRITVFRVSDLIKMVETHAQQETLGGLSGGLPDHPPRKV